MQTQRRQPMKHNINFLPFSVLQHRTLVTISLIVAFILATLSNSAFADINSVMVSASPQTLALKQSSTINAQWRINRTETTPRAVSVTRIVSSPTAILQINGTNVANLSGFISTQSTLSVSQSETVSLTESFNVSEALARRIASSPAGSAQIVRTFSDTQTSASEQIRVYIGSANTGELSVRRIDLAFENSARTDVVYKDDAVHAIADIAFRSSGILKGEWRIVEPSASLGSSGGRVLRVVRQNLVSSGEGRTRIVSPALPTSNNGLHLVSFVVEDTNIEIPILRYFVLDNQNASLGSEPSELIILSPNDGLVLHPDTTFKWQTVAGAQAYQIEIFNKGNAVPLTGKLVPASESKLILSPLSFDWLMSGNEYNWRIRAFGIGGKLLAQSELKSLYLP